jgi:hypothetical protein
VETAQAYDDSPEHEWKLLRPTIVLLSTSGNYSLIHRYGSVDGRRLPGHGFKLSTALPGHERKLSATLCLESTTQGEGIVTTLPHATFFLDSSKADLCRPAPQAGSPALEAGPPPCQARSLDSSPGRHVR